MSETTERAERTPAATVLWYDRPAANWDEALPVGNGRIGGMVFGKPDNELIQLNEDSLWSGNFRDRNNPKALANLEKMRSLINEGKVAETEKLCRDAFVGTNENQRHYQPLGDLNIYSDMGEYTDYKRTLDIFSGICTSEYTADGVKYTRTVFVSKPDQVMVIAFTADKKGAVNFSASIGGRDDNYDKNEAYDDNTLIFTVSDGIPYAAAFMICAEGGKAYTDANRLKAEGCDSAYIIVSCQSMFRSGEYEYLAISQVKKAARKGYAHLLADHTADFEELMSRSCIVLEDDSEGRSGETTEKRLAYIREGKPDSKLAELYFNFSRYLMISGSREGTLPLNLQGIWNKDMWPAWGGKYTININTEMNYWAAEMQGLHECCTPLFDHIERMREHGRVTARKMYNCRGTVCHHNTDIWGDTAPQDIWMPATLWPMGLAWLCLHIYEHYRFTGDYDFLLEKYDTLCEAAEFFVDYLTEDNGMLITTPSVSPENTYITATGEHGTICKGPSMDSQILYTLFTYIIEASDILYNEDIVDREFVDRIGEMRDRLPAPQIGKYGQIMEWSEDYDEVEPGHRHISQLFALYPGEIITAHGTPELAAAARATIERRLAHGGGHTGWSRAWIINMWARLLDGEKVYENITSLLAHSTNINMLDMHPPFQIDGNFGGGAGIGEAVLQSHSGEISFIPALPPQWKNGSASLKARGGFEVVFTWADNKFESGIISADEDSTCRLRGEYIITKINENEPENESPVEVKYADELTIFNAEHDTMYRISRKNS
ncbi:MAG: glycoside hydrolase family 95 protein [Oscillospiraceae bacterium]|nr:glycoside hydrolase family 95 protein [Oscillospiraceae bacterium]